MPRRNRNAQKGEGRSRRPKRTPSMELEELRLQATPPTIGEVNRVVIVIIDESDDESREPFDYGDLDG